MKTEQGRNLQSKKSPLRVCFFIFSNNVNKLRCVMVSCLPITLMPPVSLVLICVPLADGKAI